MCDKLKVETVQYQHMSVAPLLVSHCALAAGTLFVLAGGAAAAAVSSRFNKSLQHTSKLTGQDWINELLQGHDTRFHNELGMHKHVFKRLVKMLARLAGV
jgi:hypothetical protein